MHRISLSLLMLLACLASGPVYANCSNPTGKEADVQYNADFHTYQFCNGTTWIAYGAIGSTGGLFLIFKATREIYANLGLAAPVAPAG